MVKTPVTVTPAELTEVVVAAEDLNIGDVVTLENVALPGADFSGATMDGAALRMAELVGAARCWAANAPLYLHTLPLDKVKIDRSFVADVETNPRNASICRALLSLGHSMGLTIIAEGVETPTSLALLRQAECDTGQGFLFAKPVPAAAFAAFVSQWRGATMNANDPTATSCCVCCKEIPLDAAFTPEGAEYGQVAARRQPGAGPQVDGRNLPPHEVRPGQKEGQKADISAFQRRSIGLHGSTLSPASRTS